MSVPLKIKDVNGNIQEMNSSEQNYIAYIVGLQLKDAGADSAGSITNTSSFTSIGSYTNTFFNEAVGTHPSTSITSGSTTTTVYQNQDSSADETDSDFSRPLMWVDAGGQTGFKQMPDSDLNIAVDRALSTIYTNDYPGVFKLASSSPGVNYSVWQSSVFTDTRTDGTSIAYNIYRRDSYSAPSTVRPLFARDDSGFDGIQEMSDRQIKITFGQRAKNRIGNSKIGTYQLRSSAQGAPTDPGTWVSAGSATDTKQTTSDQTYTRDSTTNFVGNYTSSYTTLYSTNYTKLTQIQYERAYENVYVKPYTRDYTHDKVIQYEIAYENVYTTDYTRAYQQQYLIDYDNANIGLSYLPNYSGISRIYDQLLYINDYTDDYVKAYTETYAGNYAHVVYNPTFIGSGPENYLSGPGSVNYYTAGYGANKARYTLTTTSYEGDLQSLYGAIRYLGPANYYTSGGYTSPAVVSQTFNGYVGRAGGPTFAQDYEEFISVYNPEYVLGTAYQRAFQTTYTGTLSRYNKIYSDSYTGVDREYYTKTYNTLYTAAYTSVANYTGAADLQLYDKNYTSSTFFDGQLLEGNVYAVIYTRTDTLTYQLTQFFNQQYTREIIFYNTTYLGPALDINYDARNNDNTGARQYYTSNPVSPGDGDLYFFTSFTLTFYSGSARRYIGPRMVDRFYLNDNVLFYQGPRVYTLSVNSAFYDGPAIYAGPQNPAAGPSSPNSNAQFYTGGYIPFPNLDNYNVTLGGSYENPPATAYQGNATRYLGLIPFDTTLDGQDLFAQTSPYTTVYGTLGTGDNVFYVGPGGGFEGSGRYLANYARDTANYVREYEGQQFAVYYVPTYERVDYYLQGYIGGPYTGSYQGGGVFTDSFLRLYVQQYELTSPQVFYEGYVGPTDPPAIYQGGQYQIHYLSEFATDFIGNYIRNYSSNYAKAYTGFYSVAYSLQQVYSPVRDDLVPNDGPGEGGGQVRLGYQGGDGAAGDNVQRYTNESQMGTFYQGPEYQGPDGTYYLTGDFLAPGATPDAYYTVVYATSYEKNYNVEYSVPYDKTYQTDYLTDYSTLYTSIYNTAYENQYQIDYLIDYTTDYTGDYINDYENVFDREYQEDYLGNFEGNFAGETIDATSTTNETYTLYVRIA